MKNDLHRFHSSMFCGLDVNPINARGFKLKWKGIDCKVLLPGCIASSSGLAAPNVSSSVVMTGPDNLNDDCLNL